MLRRSRRINRRRGRSLSARSDYRRIVELLPTPGVPLGPAEEPQSAKMLIFLQNGEQRLITFTLPKESCTLQDVLEQVNIPFTEDTHIQCMQNTSSEIDYFVSVGSTTRIEEMLENHPLLEGDISSRSSPSSMSQPQSSEMCTPEKSQSTDDSHTSPELPPRSPPRYVDRMLAICKCCGHSGFDSSRCQRCKRVFTEQPNRVPTSKKVEQKKRKQQKPLREEQPVSGDGSTSRLPKNSLIKAINSETSDMHLPSESPERAPEVPAASNEPNFEITVQSIMNMGFNRQQVEQALRASFNYKEQAVEYLITNIPQELPQEQKIDGSPLAFLRDQPQFQQMRAVIKQKPKLLTAVLQQIGQLNAALLQTIGQHQQEFVQMLVEPVTTSTGATSAEEGALVVQPPQPHNENQMSSRDKEAIDRIKELGFPEHVVVQAYFACEKDENRAANFILSQSVDE